MPPARERGIVTRHGSARLAWLLPAGLALLAGIDAGLLLLGLGNKDTR
ncbi:hypothetical protein [Microbacterium sorbitolivorans]|nr:hypothetical protein [Microbacterium sorbitolivorans]